MIRCCKLLIGFLCVLVKRGRKEPHRRASTSDLIQHHIQHHGEGLAEGRGWNRHGLYILYACKSHYPI